MSDENKSAVSFGATPGQGQEGVVESDALNIEEGQQGTITPEQLADRLKEVEAQAANQFRMMQSLVDKRDSRVAKKIQESFKALEDRRAEMTAAGQPVSDEAFARLLEQERMNILASALEDELAAQPGEGEDTEAQEIEDTNRKALAIWEEVGVAVEEEDKEKELIDFTTRQTFLTTARAAAIVKAARLKGEGQPTETPEEIAARIGALGGSGGQSNPIADIKDPNVLIKMGLDGRKR